MKDELLERYCIVKGGSADLPPTKRKYVIGIREHAGGFEGMVATADTGGFPPSVITESATLDDIMIYMSKKGA